MTPKERAAMQQAFEAMEGIQHGTDWNNGTHAKIYRPKFPAAITALREALAKQAEQEPVAWMVTMENQDGTRKTFPLSGRYKDVRDTCDFGDPVPLYAAPVRTKDLTDDEIDEIWTQTPWSEVFHFARAVIAADREKNK